MEILLQRRWYTAFSTIGELSIEDEFQCFTLEDIVRAPDAPKIFGETAIPSGRYPVVLNMSPRFKVVMPLLCNVPGYEGVRIHPGNTAADTEGCILVGNQRAFDEVLNSRDAYAALFAKLSAVVGQIFITVANAPAVPVSS